jgi:hypothetical protein
MKDYFDQFLKPKQGEVQQESGGNASSSAPPPVAPVNQVTEEAAAVNTIAHESEDDATVEEEFCRDANKVNLWDTKIKKTVLPEKLVWAPNYRFRDQLFCARICENDEIERDLYIQLPVLPEECVVELICVPKTKAEDTRLIKVRRSKIVPFYGKNDPTAAEQPKTEWNEKLVEKMKKVSLIVKHL